MKLIIRPRPPESGLFRYRISSGYLFTRIRVDRTLNHRERFHKCGFNEQILWFRVAVALQLQPVTDGHTLSAQCFFSIALEWRLVAFFLDLALVQ